MLRSLQPHRGLGARRAAAAAPAAAAPLCRVGVRPTSTSASNAHPAPVAVSSTCQLPHASSSGRRHRRGTTTTAAAAEAAPEAAVAAAGDLPKGSEAAVDASSTAELTVEEPPGFEELGVDPLLVAGLAEGGITLPSPIQESAIPVLLRGSNAAIQAYTGSGKTLAFLLPALTLALRRAEAAYRRRQAAAAAGAAGGPGRGSLREEDLWTVQAVVVAPSQELAMQICRVAQGLLPKDSRSAVQQAIGGANLRRQADAIVDHQPLLVVGTPGRIVDLIGVGVLRLHRCPLLILDEADQLQGDVYSRHLATITEHCGKRLGSSGAGSSGAGSSTASGAGPQMQQNAGVSAAGAADADADALPPSGRQTVLVSATLWSGGLARFASWCRQPQFVTMGASPTWSDEDGEGGGGGGQGSDEAAAKAWGWGAKGWEGPASVVQHPRTQGSAGGPDGQAGLVPTLPPNLEHMYIVVNPERKSDVLRRAVHALNLNMGLGFMNWQQRLKDMAAKVAAKKIEVGTLHGELQPSERGVVLDAARNGAFRMLLVSDLAARGLDLPQVDAVFNLELPSSAAHYAHRAGRTGRMGAPGLVVSLVAPGERFVVERLSKKLGVPILECHLAGGELVVGPPPPRTDTKKQQAAKRAADAAAAADAGGQPEQQQPQQKPGSAAPAAGAADKQQEQERRRPGVVSGLTRSADAALIGPLEDDDGDEEEAEEQADPAAGAVAAAAAAAAAAVGGVAKRTKLRARAAAGAPGAAAEQEAGDDDGGVYLLDEDDELEVEGDEPLEVYRQRVWRELEAELAEIREERQQRRLRQQQGGPAGDAAAAAAADGGGGDGEMLPRGRQVRQKVASALRGRAGGGGGSGGPPYPKGSPQEAAAMAMAAIQADEAARRAKLPPELLPAVSGGGGSSDGGDDGGDGGGGGGGRRRLPRGGRGSQRSSSSGGRGGRGGRGRQPRAGR